MDLYKDNLSPIAARDKSWNSGNFIALWLCIVICTSSYMFGGIFINEGFNWWQSLLSIAVGNITIYIIILAIGYVGYKYGISCPVLLRSSFGTIGSKLAGMFRGIVGCGWYGIDCWIGGTCIYNIISFFLPDLREHSIYLSLLDADLYRFLIYDFVYADSNFNSFEGDE